MLGREGRYRAPREYWGRIQRGEKPLEKPPENPPENPLDMSYTGKSPKIGSLDMS